jgi:transposase InsO family protein
MPACDVDNSPAYVSRRFAKACKALDLTHIPTRPYTPRTNGKAERFIQTLCREWAYGMPFQNSEERNQWRPRHPEIYNRLRKHKTIGGRSPQQRLNKLLF